MHATGRFAPHLRKLKEILPRNYTATAYINSEKPDTSFENDWKTGKPFESIPRPGKFEYLRSFFPGGSLKGKSAYDINTQLRKEYGDIFLLPGLFGKRDFLYTFNPEDFQKVYRTEGFPPTQRGLKILEYHRKVHRPEIFKNASGLVSEQGEGWARFRSAVNPVLMNPKTFHLYTPKVNGVVDQFIDLIRRIRDPHTLEMPDNFDEEINYWTMESVGVIALDTHLGLIDRSVTNKKLKVFIDNIRDFFELLFQLEIKPSIWKYVSTPNFKRCISTLDSLTDMIIYYTEEAKKRMRAEEAKGITKSEFEKSILERLIQIDPNIATVMVGDIILAGVDTTTTALVGCLFCLSKNPEKQQKLREEILKILPNKNSPLSTDAMSNLPYLRASIKESLRVYPVAPGTIRRTGQDIVLSGYRVPRGIDVNMAMTPLLSNEKYYPRPKEYLPERWLRGPEAVDTTGCPLNHNVPFVFLPFGHGPRNCIGKRIVNLELEVMLAKLVRNFEIGFDYSTHDAFKAHIINIPAKPLKFKFKELEK